MFHSKKRLGIITILTCNSYSFRLLMFSCRQSEQLIDKKGQPVFKYVTIIIIVFMTLFKTVETVYFYK